MARQGLIDRLAMRARPDGVPIMHQRWENLLFLHWPVDPDVIRHLLPPAVEVDTFEGKAWIGITPFHLAGLRPVLMPGIPGLRSFQEVNVRTYVVHHGIPGIWFFSLDASKLIPAAAARMLFMLPYHQAKIRFPQTGQPFVFDLDRPGPPPARFNVSWRGGMRLRAPDTESLAFFLVERYCAFAQSDEALYSIRINHHPWILTEALDLSLGETTILSAQGLPESTVAPLAHFSEPVEVEIWPPVEVGLAEATPAHAR